MPMLIAWIVLAALAIAVAVAVTCLIAKPMGTMLGSNSYMAPGRKFYVRAFAVAASLAALATIAGRNIPAADKGESMAAMEYVWWVVGGLQPAFLSIALFLMGYVVVLTILLAVLGRYRDA